MSKKKEKLPLEEASDLIFALNHLPVPPLTSEELIERGLLLAKPSPSDEEMVEAAVFYHYSGFAAGQLSAHFEKHLPANEALNWWKDHEIERTEFRNRLAELVKNPRKAISDSKLDLRMLDRKILIAAGLDLETGEIVHRFFPLTTEAGYKYVLQKLCASERWKRLRKCEFEKCDAYFFRKVNKFGGRPRIYCTPDCQLKADAIHALPRQKRKRRRDKPSSQGTNT